MVITLDRKWPTQVILNDVIYAGDFAAPRLRVRHDEFGEAAPRCISEDAFK